MELIDKYASVVEKITLLLSNVSDDWAFVGSMNHYIQGVRLVPNDIDIITTKEGIFKIEEVLRKYSTRKVNYSNKKLIRSFYGEFVVDSIKIELFSEIENRINGKWHEHPEWEGCIIKYLFNGIEIPLLPLEYELLVYKRLGMKQRERKLLNQIMKP